MGLGIKYFDWKAFHSSLILSEAPLRGLGDSSERTMESVSVFAAFYQEYLKKQRGSETDVHASLFGRAAIAFDPTRAYLARTLSHGGLGDEREDQKCGTDQYPCGDVFERH